MATPKVLWRDGFDAYVDDLDFMQDTMEDELQERMKSITNSKGVATGMAATAITDKVEIAVGTAYDDDRARVVVSGSAVQTPVLVGGDVNKYVCIENTVVDSLVDSHPVDLSTRYRRALLSPTVSVQASPTANQIKLCKITAVNPGNPPTIDTDPPNRETLSLGVGTTGGSVTNPYIVVANDGSGDYADLASGIAALPASGGMIFVKAGTYPISTTITTPVSNVRIVGAGPATVLQGDGASIYNILELGGGGEASIVIESLTFDWLDGTDPGAGQDNTHIRILTGTDTTIRDCTFRDAAPGITNPFGIKIEDGTQRVEIVDCFFDTLYKAIVFDASASTSDHMISNCDTLNCRFGIHGEANADRISITGCGLDGDGNAASRGIKMDTDCDDWCAAGNVIQDFNVGIDTDGTGGAFSGNQMPNCTTSATLTANCTYTVYAGNSYRGSGAPTNAGGGTNIITPNVG